MHERERRQALADFLRQRRAQLTPAEVDLPPGIRRRTPGLRREEVAQLANMGTSWYVWLEQGRDVHPSAQVLESLAQALRLTPNERRHLFLLAGQPLPPPPVSPTEESVSPALQQVLDDLNPAPAYVMGRRYDYLGWNKAADVRSALDGHKVIEHPTLGYLEFEHFTLQVLNNPDIRIMIYTPNAGTRTTLQRVLEAMASR